MYPFNDQENKKKSIKIEEIKKQKETKKMKKTQKNQFKSNQKI